MTWRLIAFAVTAFAVTAFAPAIVAGQAVAPDDPRATVRAAAAAVRGDSVPAVRDRWQVRVGRDSSDRAALLGLATLDRLTYDYPSAERIYRRLDASVTPDRYSVYARLGLARGFDEYGHDAREVDDLYVRALADARTLKDRTAEGEALISLAAIRSQSHGLTVGLALLDSALRVLPAKATDLQISARCRRAQMRVVMGRGERDAQLASAMALARRATEPRAPAACVRARAIALSNRGRADSAAAVYAAHAEALRRANDHSGYALALGWQAQVLRDDLGDYAQAREVLAVAQREADLSHNLYTGAFTKLLLGQVFLTLNDYDAATSYLDQAVDLAAVVADSEVINVSRSWRAVANLATGHLADARRESLETLEFFRREGDLYNQAEVMKTLANIAIRGRDWPVAATALDSSEAMLRRLGVPAQRAVLPFERGRLALYRGDFALATREFTRHLDGLDSSAHLQRYEARAYLADSYARTGDLADAERLLSAAADDIDRWRATLSARDLRVTAFQANATAQNDRNASVARVLAALAEAGRVEFVFSLAERRRARELIDRMQQNIALERPREGRRGTPGLSGRLEQVTAAEVAATLPPRTALIEYITGALGAPTTVIVLTRGRAAKYLIRAKLLPPADSLTAPIGRFVALASRGEDATAEATALGAALLEPAVDLLTPDVTRLVIVPDGALHRVPWDALRLQDGRAAVDRFAIGVAPSAALVTALWRTRSRGAGSPARLLAFGDPVFPAPGRPSSAGPDATFGTYESAFEANGGLPRLEGSGREVRAIARYARSSEVLLRESASESALERTPLASYRVIHFATHALVDDRVSVRTALALAPGNGEDGFVTPGELARLRLGADLVVLSACRTAGGVVVDGEGVQGLTAPLLEAGARSVVATSWRVGDERTVWFVEQFYAALARGLPVADALREAKLEALRSGAGVKVWAAFTVVGDPFVTVRLGSGER